MTAPAAMVIASLLFACMGVFAKLASAHYGTAELVFYRSLIGTAVMAAIARHQRTSLRTTVPGAHMLRSAFGVVSLFLWFYALGALPLSTAVTLNYLSSVWIAVFVIGMALVLRRGRLDWRLVAAVLGGFAGVALVLQPSVEHPQQWWGGLAGLLAGLFAAVAYLQVTALGRAGEPDTRVVFYFSIAGGIGGAIAASAMGWHAHSLLGMALLIAMSLPAVAGQLLLTRAYGRGKPLVNASLQYLGIVFSTALGVVLFGDRIGWMGLTGILMIIGSGVFATYLNRAASLDAANVAKP